MREKKFSVLLYKLLFIMSNQFSSYNSLSTNRKERKQNFQGTNFWKTYYFCGMKKDNRWKALEVRRYVFTLQLMCQDIHHTDPNVNIYDTMCVWRDECLKTLQMLLPSLLQTCHQCNNICNNLFLFVAFWLESKSDSVGIS